MEEDRQDLMKACRLGDMALIRSAVSEAVLNEKEEGTGWTPLYCAGVFGHSDAVLYLLEKGADPNVQSVRGDTLLHYAVDSGQYRIAAYVLEAAANPNCQNEGEQQLDGDTPLHHASSRGDVKLVRLLFRHRADHSVQNGVGNRQLGRTPLHCAVAANQVATARMLIQNGASPMVEDLVADRQQHIRPLDLCKSQDMVSSLTSPLQSRKSTPSTNFLNPSPDPRDEMGPATTSPRSSTLSNHSPLPELAEFRQIEEKIKRLEDLNKKIRDTIRTSTNALSQDSPIRHGRRITTPDTVLRDDGRFLGWLAGLRLEAIYPNLVEAGFDDLGQLVTQMKSDLPLTDDLLESLGIEKQGHRAVFLAALERECVVPMSTMPAMKGKRRSLYCCQAPAPAPTMFNYPSLQVWLEALGLGHLSGLFEDAGYTEVEQMLLLMHSQYQVTDAVLKHPVGIEKVGHRHRILCKLREDAQHFDPKSWPAYINYPYAVRHSREERHSSCSLM